MTRAALKLVTILCLQPAAAVLSLLAAEAQPSTAESPGTAGQKVTRDIGSFDIQDAPTYIKSESLFLDTIGRKFIYTGNVEVDHGDMKITSDKLEGIYDQQNRIERILASSNVTIIKSDNIRARSEKALYESKTETLVLTENPELQQDGSILTADQITIFLSDNRSVAEGQVRVKLVEAKENSAAKPPALSQPSASEKKTRTKKGRSPKNR